MAMQVQLTLPIHVALSKITPTCKCSCSAAVEVGSKLKRGRRRRRRRKGRRKLLPMLSIKPETANAIVCPVSMTDKFLWYPKNGSSWDCNFDFTAWLYLPMKQKNENLTRNQFYGGLDQTVLINSKETTNFGCYSSHQKKFHEAI